MKKIIIALLLTAVFSSSSWAYSGRENHRDNSSTHVFVGQHYVKNDCEHCVYNRNKICRIKSHHHGDCYFKTSYKHHREGRYHREQNNDFQASIRHNYGNGYFKIIFGQ